MVLVHLLRAMRPRQWTKNLVVFAAIVFDRKLAEPRYLAPVVAGFGLLCMLASSVYLINDLVDIEQDRQHPTKRYRPIASGVLPRGIAIATAVLLPLVALPLSFQLDTWFGVWMSVYWLQNLAYSFKLKHVVIVDVMMIALGFVLRVGAGVVLVDVKRFSPWLYMCVTLGALFIGLGKRRHELSLLEENANTHRAVLDHYNLPLIDWMIATVASSTIVAYSLYTFSAPDLPANNLMMLTVPFVIYGIFRYLYLIHVEGKGGAPDELIYKDGPLFLTAMFWASSAVLILYLA